MCGSGWVCMCIVRKCFCICVWGVYVCMCVYMCGVCVHMCVDVGVCMCVYVGGCVCMCILYMCVCVCMCVYMCMCMYVGVCMWGYMCVCICVWMWVYVCMCVCMCIVCICMCVCGEVSVYVCVLGGNINWVSYHQTLFWPCLPRDSVESLCLGSRGYKTSHPTISDIIHKSRGSSVLPPTGCGLEMPMTAPGVLLIY